MDELERRHGFMDKSLEQRCGRREINIQTVAQPIKMNLLLLQGQMRREIKDRCDLGSEIRGGHQEINEQWKVLQHSSV